MIRSQSELNHVARGLGAAPRITAHAERRRAALDRADFVLNMVQIGGHRATLLDFELPARVGLRQTIADTLGIGGIFRTLRTADHMLALGNEIAELCPRAWLLNYTNPTIDAPPVTAEAVLAAADLQDEAEGKLFADEVCASFTACLDARHRVTPGVEVELAVDPRRLHFFEPKSGAAFARSAEALVA